MTHLSSNVNESGVLRLKILAESSEVKEMRVEFASVVVLDRKNEVNPNTLSTLGGTADVGLVFSLKTKIDHVFPGKTVNDIVLILVSLLLILKELLMLESNLALQLIEFVIFCNCFFGVEFMVGHVSIKLLVYFFNSICY